MLSLKDVTGEFTAKTTKSKELFDEAMKITPGGVHSAIRNFNPYPFFVRRAKGSKLWDVDGNKYIDYCLAYGVNIAGHSHPRIVEAVNEQMEKGSIYGMPSELSTKHVSELLRRYPMIDMFRLTVSGGEATMYAIRTARAYTNKEKIVKVEGCYHGAHDYLLISDKPPLDKAGTRFHPTPVVESDGIPHDTAKNTLVAPYNNIEAMEYLFKKYEGEIAAVILEPVMGTSSIILPRDNYLGELRKLTEEYNVVLIFDEVKTGCRVAPGGACEVYKIRPDMVTLAKAIGGGLPLAAFGGKREIMELISPLGRTAHYGTYNACTIAVAAGYACLKEVLTNDSHHRLNKLGDMMIKGFRDVLRDEGIEAQVNGLGPMCNILFTEKETVDYRTAAACDLELWKKYWLGMVNLGSYITGNAWYEPCFISTAHTEEDINKTLEDLKNVLSRIR